MLLKIIIYHYKSSIILEYLSEGGKIVKTNNLCINTMAKQ